MLLIKSNKVKLLLCSLIFSNLYAQTEAFDEKILSEKRLKNFDLTGVSSYKMFSGATSFKQEYPAGCSDNCLFKDQENE